MKQDYHREALEPARLENPSGASSYLLLCDHASNLLPPGCADLGLSDEQMQAHIARDIGAGDLAMGLSRRLDAPAVLAGYSRLYIDCNRRIGDPTAIPDVSDDIPVPGNRDLSSEDIAHRVDQVHGPYHAFVEQQISSRADRGTPPVLLSIHSFTPRMNGFERPWHIGVQWNRDPGFAKLVAEALEDGDDITVGRNQPYNEPDKPGHTVERHAPPRNLRNVILEVRQDILCTQEGRAAWVDRLARVFTRLEPLVRGTTTHEQPPVPAIGTSPDWR